MKLKIIYGYRFLEVDVPEERIIAVTKPKEVPKVSDEDEEIKKTLDNPIGTKKIDDLARGKKNAVILVDDETRPTPAYKVMPIVLDRLNEAGIKDEDITVLIALGTHRPMKDKEIEAKIGKESAERVRVVNHDSKNKEMLIDTGIKTSTGIPILINKLYAETDLKIAIGSLSLNLASGVGGGSKIIHPGVCGFESMNVSHWLCAEWNAEKRLIGTVENPFRKEADEIAKTVGLDMLINAVLNVRKEIVKVVAGDVIKAHRVAVKKAEEICKVEIPDYADVVIADGFEKEINLWQLTDVIALVDLALKPGGSVALLAPCWEGLSDPYHPSFGDIGLRSYQEIKQSLSLYEDKIAAGICAIAGDCVSRAKGYWLFSDRVSKKDSIKMNLKYAETPQDAVDKAIESQPPDAKIIVMNHAAATLPVVRKS